MACSEAARGYAAFCGEAGSEGEGKSLGSVRAYRSRQAETVREKFE